MESMCLDARSLVIDALAALICVLIGLTLLACGDKSPPRNPIVGGGEADAGSDAADVRDGMGDAVDIVVDPTCEGIDEGGACELDNAAGVCVRGECRFLSCRTGFRDCDDDLSNGCEADVTGEARCGSCDTQCSQTAICQPSSLGYVCASTPVCLPGRLDVDGDVSNGCEFRIYDVGTSLSRPGDLDITAGDLSQDVFYYAGLTSGGPVVGATDTDETPERIDAASSTGPALGLVKAASDDQILTAWRTGVSSTRTPQSSSDDAFARPECLGPLDAHGLTGIDRARTDIVAADHGLFEWSTGAACAGSACLLPIFDRIDYLRSYYPYPAAPATSVVADPEFALPESSLSACDTCFLDTATAQITSARACLGDTVCAQQTSADCSTCEPDLQACPDFEPVAVLSSEPHASLVVVTRTGLLVLRADGESWRGGPRAEDFLGDVTVLRAAITVADGVATAFLLGDDSRVYTAEVDLAAGGAIRVERAPFSVAIPVDTTSVQLHAANDRELMVSSRVGAVLIRSTPRGNIQAPIPPPETAIDTRELVATGYDRARRSYGLLYSSLGQLTLRTVSLASAGPGEPR